MSQSKSVLKARHLARFIRTAFSGRSTRACYDITAQFYDELFGDNQERYSRYILDCLDKKAHTYQYALDLGAGTGILTTQLKKICDTVVGIDYSYGMLKHASAVRRDRSGLYYVNGDVRFLPFPDKTYDLITCLGVVTHILPEHFKYFVSELSRVAKLYSTLVIAMPPLPWRIFIGNKNTLDPSGFDRLLIKCYNLLQQRLGLEERRGFCSLDLFDDHLGRYGYSVEMQDLNHLATIIAQRDIQ